MRRSFILSVPVVFAALIVLPSVAWSTAVCGEDSKATPAAEKAVPAEQSEEGFVSLFDGKTLNGWRGAVKGYDVVDGVLVCGEKARNIHTEKEYADFVFRFEFKLEPGANNGVALRWAGKGNPAYVAMECQILDNSAPRYKNIKPWQRHGSLYALSPAKKGHLKPVGQWNAEEIVVQGTKVKVTLNGAVILDADLTTLDPKGLDDKDHPGRLNKKGFLGLLGHTNRAEFRNLRIKEL